MNSKAAKIKAIAASIVFLMAFFISSTVFAACDANNPDYKNPDCNGLTTSAGGLYKSESTVQGSVSTIITTAISMLGVIFMVLMVYGGFLWMTARGDEGQVTKAKDLITAAIIGLVIVMGAYAITYFVIYNAATNAVNMTS